MSDNLQNQDASTIAQTGQNEQFGRVCTLLVSDLNGNALDLSQLQIKFAVKRSDTSTPNTASIRVYNLSDETAALIKKEFKRVVLDAGYPSNHGIVFQGNIKQVILGRESAISTFIEIIAGDGDRAYNFSVVTTTIGAGASQQDQVKASTDAMAPNGVTVGQLSDLPTNKLPRGKVMYGAAKNYLRNTALTTKSSWSIQNEKVTFIANRGYLPGERVVLTSLTGMIGTPNQTEQGVNIKCLLNPKIQVGGRVVIDNKSVLQQALNLDQIAASQGDVSAINKITPRDLAYDGTYYVLVLEYEGDNRGTPWYCNLVTITTNVSTNPLNSVQVGTS